MVGIIIELALSWLLLWLIERKNLLALGVALNYSRIRDLLFGILIASCCCVIYYVSITTLSNSSWIINADFSLNDFIRSFGWTVNSVLYEELIFRGALLYILIQKTNERLACAASAIAFGIYHWFSFGIIGDARQMTFVFLMTGVWGLMFAFSFSRTKSLYLPIGLHLGWNLFQNVIFSQGPQGKQLLTNTSPDELLGPAMSLVFFLFQVLAIPFAVYWYLRRYAK